MLIFLDVESAKLRGRTQSEASTELSWLGFGLMQSLKHAITAQLFGPDHAGQAPSREDMKNWFRHGLGTSKSYELH